MALLKQLGELRDAGVVTNEEFEAKKKDLLGRL
ncbi:SHOCT domain-containing protein [Actinomadura sp. KC06]|nr:SHOCT domain-containing protein [Actinomadura sp. KC06]